jgi:adenylosuccinate lyase
MLNKLNSLMDRWVIYPERMRENLDRSGKLLCSEHVMLSLIRTGLTREEAYARVQGPAMAAWADGSDFEEKLAADPEVGGILGGEALARCFNMNEHFKNIDAIFERVFGPHPG